MLISSLYITDICSHNRSVEFYAESIRDNNAFIGKCRNHCNNVFVPMGYATPSNVLVFNFYLNRKENLYIFSFLKLYYFLIFRLLLLYIFLEKVIMMFSQMHILPMVEATMGLIS